MMKDIAYFNIYKKHFETVFSQCDELAYIKDMNFKYQSITDNMFHIFDVTSSNQILNRTNAELPIQRKPLQELIPQFTKQDIEIKNGSKRKVFLDILPCSNELKVYVVHKTPIINPHTSNFVGMRGQLTNLFLPHVVKLLFKIHGTHGLLITKESSKNILKEYNLTSMQHMVLFLCLNNYSYTEIALLLSEFVKDMSPTQVNGYLEELKLIFHVRTKTQLIEKAVGLNFNAYLPHKLFKPASISLNNEIASLIDVSQIVGH